MSDHVTKADRCSICNSSFHTDLSHGMATMNPSPDEQTEPFTRKEKPDVYKKDGKWFIDFGDYGASHKFKYMALRKAEKMRKLTTGIMQEYKGKGDDYEF